MKAPFEVGWSEFSSMRLWRFSGNVLNQHTLPKFSEIVGSDGTRTRAASCVTGQRPDEARPSILPSWGEPFAEALFPRPSYLPNLLFSIYFRDSFHDGHHKFSNDFDRLLQRGVSLKTTLRQESLPLRLFSRKFIEVHLQRHRQ